MYVCVCVCVCVLGARDSLVLVVCIFQTTGIMCTACTGRANHVALFSYVVCTDSWSYKPGSQ